MNGSAAPDPNRLFAQAQQDYQTGNRANALELLDQIERLVGTHVSLWHLRALCLAAERRPAEAKAAFERAIALQPAPGDPVLLANFARLLRESGDGAACLAAYDAAIKLAPNNQQIIQARFAALRQFRGDAAVDAGFEEALARQPSSGELHHYHALFLQDSGRHQDALAAVRRAIGLRPQSIAARHLEARLLLDLGQPDVALFRQLCSEQPDDPDLLRGLAAALFQSGQPVAALDVLDGAVGRWPQHTEIARARLSMTQQVVSAAEAERWLAGYSCERAGDWSVAALHLNYLWRLHGAASALERMGKPDEAEPLAMRILRAELLSETGAIAQADRSYHALEAALESAPPDVQMAPVRHLFRAERFDAATQKALSVARSSNLMEAWAHVELGWRLLNDKRWSWLMRDGAVVHHDALPGFEGYSSELAAVLRLLHAQLKSHPPEQSPRGGTQTDGVLLARSEAPIPELRQELEDLVARYCAALGALDEAHPLAAMARMPRRFAGSWSIRLSGAGYHTPHFHNQGLVSSACYISLPEAMADPAARERHDGWLEFGCPPRSLGVVCEPVALIEPAPGRLALFPSFLFHGTRPFADGERLVLAFDVAPGRDWA